MVSIFIHRSGRTERATSLDRAWLNPASGTIMWVDLASPSIPESLILSDTFVFHPLSVEDALAAIHHPKIEAYDGGMNVPLPRLPGRDGDQFWWLFGLMMVIVVLMLGLFRRKRWI